MPLKILVLISRFSLSGVPLAQIRFAQALVRAGHNVEIVVGHVNDGYTVPAVENVSVRIWKHPRVSTMVPSLIKYFVVDKPDVVFSAEDHLNSMVLLAAFLSHTKAKISCSSRVTPIDKNTRKFGAYSDKIFTKRWALKQFMKLVMARADALTCVSQDMVYQYKEVFKNSRHVCVYNIIEDAQAADKMALPVEEEWFDNKLAPVIVAAGTLARRKGFHDLIMAMAELKDKTAAKLLILGTGPSHDSLQKMIVGAIA